VNDPERQWFFDHYADAAGQIVDFLAGDGISLEGLRVADVGAGDGIIDLGLAQNARPKSLVGFDIVPTNAEDLLRRAREQGVAERLPSSLEFRHSEPTRLPARDGEFDIVVTWSAFEHIREPIGVLREVRRILKPQGILFLQLWPFYHSERGSHLWEWFPGGFHHLVDDSDAIERTVRERSDRPEWSEYMLKEFRELNRITVDELQLALQSAGLEVRKLELLTNPVHIPREALRYPLSTLGITGVKLLAVPA
jgi:ubiquinone/menaquinone biosynthesis C-methylase UbiE